MELHLSDLGPGVRAVVGADEMVTIAPSAAESDQVSLLRPVAPNRHILIMHDRAGTARYLPSLAERLLWLDGRVHAPELIASARSEDLSETLVIRLHAEAMVASDALVPVDPESMARQMGNSLRSIHDLPVAGCPFESSIAHWRGVAGERVDAGLVRPQASGPYAGLEAEHLLDVFDQLNADSGGNDADTDLGFIHGSPTREQIWLVPDGSLVFTSWQNCGIGDRHHDLAVAAADLVRTFGPALVPPFLDSYGIDRVRPERLDRHQLLVHLCGLPG